MSGRLGNALPVTYGASERKGHAGAPFAFIRLSVACHAYAFSAFMYCPRSNADGSGQVAWFMLPINWRTL